jgi:hypothetical protein
MLSDAQFFKEIITCVKLHNPRRRHLFMHAEKERAHQTSRYSPLETFEIDYKRWTLAVQVFCDPSIQLGNLYVQVIDKRLARSTNTQHVTLTQKNVIAENYFVRPSLVRCKNGMFRFQPKKIGRFPYLLSGKKNVFIVGPMNDLLLSRIFEVAVAKYKSI